MASLPELPPISYDHWRRQVEEQLAGRSFDSALTTTGREGIRLEPLYSAENAVPDTSSVPGVTPFVGGERPWGGGEAPWLIAQEYDDPRRDRLAATLAKDRRQGVQLVWLRFDRQTRSSFTLTRAGGTGLRVVKPRHFDPLWDADGGDKRGLEVVLDAGAAAPIVLALWLESARRRGLPWSELRGCAGFDPLGALAADGRLAMPMADAWRQMADTAVWCHGHLPGVRASLVSTVAHHHAGATAVDEIAIALATGAAYFRRLLDAGLAPDAAAGQILFAFAVSDDIFLEIAKLRAVRGLWARFLAACGVGPQARYMRLHARTSDRSATRRDVRGNLLRGTAQTFAAAVAGAWSVTVRPFDAPLGQAEEQGHRLAINTHHILAEEAHLGRVADAAAGSWYVETLSDHLARAGWQRCQQLEEDGGIEMNLLSGRLAARLKKGADALRQEVALRRTKIVGVSEFANLAEEPASRWQPEAPPVEIDESSFPPGLTAARLEDLALAVEHRGEIDGRLITAISAAVADGALATDVAQLLVGDGPVSCPRLDGVRLAQPFEDLRSASEQWANPKGRPPRLLLLHLGPLAEHGPRASFLRQLVATAGIECVSSEPCSTVDEALAALGRQGVDGTVLCGTDARYGELLPPLASALKAAGAGWLFLGGNPGDAEPLWRQAGIDSFLFQGCDVLSALETFLADLGVWA